jgi:hypothetical protein
MKINLYLLVFTIFFAGCTSSEKKVENIRSFAKVYGYVRWFYPGDEAATTDWDKFAVYGVGEVENARSHNSLKRKLQKLFNPIAPALIIEEESRAVDLNPRLFIPADTAGLQPVYWIHYGVNLGNRSNIYKSGRMNRDSIREKMVKRNGGDFNPEILDVKIGDFIRKDIGNDLVCIMPLVLYGDQNHTLPVSEERALIKLKDQLNNIPDSSLLNIHFPGQMAHTICLANVVIAWNVFQHFYPYFDVVDMDWDTVLTETVYDVMATKTEADYFKSLCRMVAKLQDGHGNIYNETIVRWSLPIAVAWIEDRVVVTATASTLFQRGDIIDSIDSKSAIEEVIEQEKFISGSPQLKRYRALNLFGSDFSQSEASVVIHRENAKLTIKAHRTFKSNPFFNSAGMERLTNMEPDKGIYYLHSLGIKTDKDWDKFLQAKGIIMSPFFDAIKIIPHLITEPVRSTDFMVPVHTWPDREKIYFDNNQWMIVPQKPFIDAPVIFIINASIVSYGETFLDIIHHYMHGQLVGETTAGTNGNNNFIPLMGGYLMEWTGMKVLKHDGSRLHLVGYEPDYPVERTIRAIKEGRDEYIEKAIEIIKNENSKK